MPRQVYSPLVGADGVAPPEYLNNEFTVRPAAIYGIYSQLEEDRVIETRALPCTPGVQAQFATLAVPSISADGETPTLTSEDICS